MTDLRVCANLTLSSGVTGSKAVIPTERFSSARSARAGEGTRDLLFAKFGVCFKR